MDRRIRKYVLYKIKNEENYRKELAILEQKRKKLREEVLDSGYSTDFDGQPRGKGGTSDITQKKALRLIEIDRRVERLKNELNIFKDMRDRIKQMDKRTQDIFEETIRRDCIDLTAKAQLLKMGRRQLIQRRAAILEMYAKELGEYIDLNEEYR